MKNIALICQVRPRLDIQRVEFYTHTLSNFCISLFNITLYLHAQCTNDFFRLQTCYSVYIRLQCSRDRWVCIAKKVELRMWLKDTYLYLHIPLQQEGLSETFYRFFILGALMWREFLHGNCLIIFCVCFNYTIDKFFVCLP